MDEDVWAPIRYFVGSWTGEEDGSAGVGRGTRRYAFILQSQFLQVTNRSVFEPQPKNPSGEVHEDTGVLSYDRSRQVFVCRAFYSEGFVNQYALAMGQDGKEFVFTTEHVENGPPGLCARLTDRIIGPDAFEEVFELAPAGKGFVAYLHNRWTRQRESA